MVEDKKRFNTFRNCDGVITIEACITGVMFLILMLCLSGLFIVYMAQSRVSDTALKTVQSLSVETYSLNKLHYSSDYGDEGSISGSIATFISTIFGNREPANRFYFSHEQHLLSPADNTWWTSSQETIASVAKKRFIGYLSGGDEDQADKILKGLNVVNGLQGLDFSQSYVEDEVLHLVIVYDIKYPFDLGGNFGTKTFTEKCCSKLWLDGV